MPIAPEETVLNHFGLQLVSSLGGRQNQHWLVKQRATHLVLRGSPQSIEEVRYETQIIAHLVTHGWPVAPLVDEPFVFHGAVWTIAPLLSGKPRDDKNSLAEQRERGQLLAALHNDLAQLEMIGQRGRWRRCEEILSDPTIDDLLNAHAQHESAPILYWHLEEARKRIAQLKPDERPGSIIHGDFTPWNLLYNNQQVSGLLDFELTHCDHRIADFALAWRGNYDEVIRAYHEVSPLDAEEWALLTPMWWAFLIEGACHELRHNLPDDGWTIKQLLRRSPLMQAKPYQ